MNFVAGRPWVVRILAVVVVIALGLAAISAVRRFLGKAEVNKRVVHDIALIKQPPPPPPKPEVKPPEPPKMKEEIKIPQPDQPKPDEPKAADEKPASDKPLGVDAAGGAGSDGFGLAGRIGGKDLLSTGGGGAYYTGLIQRQFYEALMKNKKIQKSDFRVVIRAWIGDDGSISRAVVVNGSGNAELDTLIQASLIGIPPLKEVPPLALREVEVRLSNRS